MPFSCPVEGYAHHWVKNAILVTLSHWRRWITAVQTTIRASFCSKCPHQPPEKDTFSFPPAVPVTGWAFMQKVSVFYPKMEAVRASAPEAEQSRVYLVNLHFKFPASCFFCTVYLWISLLCRPSSRVNPHLSTLKRFWRHVNSLAYYSLVIFLCIFLLLQRFCGTCTIVVLLCSPGQLSRQYFVLNQWIQLERVSMKNKAVFSEQDLSTLEFACYSFFSLKPFFMFM